MDGIFSVKSDVFGFGVLLLEILSGQRNGATYFQDHQQSLIQDAWKLWSDDEAMELMDPTPRRCYPAEEARRFFQVGLLCVQDDPKVWPTMSGVLLMLVSDHVNHLPVPARPLRNEPLFPAARTPPTTAETAVSSSSKSVNYVSITAVQPR